ncbi:uncharacterized protein DS421_14g461580 [Arachis hypogaea]|nr:uncharacterized protein DS421_14g461580 [Arachis hypogaea]
MASPFKTKNLDEPIGSKDIKNIMEQANYTNKYLQTLGQKLSSSSNSTHDSPKAPEKPLFKPFKINPKIRQNLKSSIFKQDSGTSELVHKIDHLLSQMTIPNTPQTIESSTRVTRQSAKTSINVLHEESQDSDNGLDLPRVNPIMTTSITKWKGLTKPHQHYHLQNTALDLALEDRELGFNSFNANTVYEWNIDGKWIKTNDNGEPILNENGKTIPDAVSTLIFTIANHFIDDPSLWKDRSAELLSNLKCKSLSDFKWYKDTFITKVFTREDSQRSF